MEYVLFNQVSHKRIVNLNVFYLRVLDGIKSKACCSQVVTEIEESWIMKISVLETKKRSTWSWLPLLLKLYNQPQLKILLWHVIFLSSTKFVLCQVGWHRLMWIFCHPSYLHSRHHEDWIHCFFKLMQWKIVFFKYRSCLFAIVQWVLVGQCINCETLFTVKLISSHVIDRYCSVP